MPERPPNTTGERPQRQGRRPADSRQKEAEALAEVLEVVADLHDIAREDVPAATGARALPPPPSGRGKRRSRGDSAAPTVNDVLGSLAYVASLQGRRGQDADPALQVLQNVVKDWIVAQTQPAPEALRETSDYYKRATEHVQRLGGMSLGRKREGPRSEGGESGHGPPPGSPLPTD